MRDHLALLAMMAAAAPAFGIHETTTEFRFPLVAGGEGQSIEIKGVIGDVVAEPSTDGNVQVVAQRKSAEGDPARVTLQVVHHGVATTVCAVYPGAASSAECVPGRDSGSGGGASDVEVNFRVRVPAGVRFVARTANGKVAASRLHGPVEAHTVNGNIDIQTEGEALAFTVNGSITASLHAMEAAASLQTVNGNVTVKVCPHGAAEFDAHTVNGVVNAALPIFHTGGNDSHFSGILGRGGSRLDLRTVNGDIFLQPLHK